MFKNDKSINSEIKIQPERNHESYKTKPNHIFNLKMKRIYLILLLIFALIIAFYIIILIIYSKNYFSSLKKFFLQHIINNKTSIIINNKSIIMNITNNKIILTNTKNQISNINYKDKFFNLNEVRQQIKSKNLTYINTILPGNAKIGNSLIVLNNLIIICERIKCRNIIAPKSLQIIIKKPIYIKEKNFSIFPYKYRYKIKVDIYLRRRTIFNFKFKNIKNRMRLTMIRNEIWDNIPKYNCTKNDLVIHIRSGDIFINRINRFYSQPPLCFYQRIINKNKFENIYITSNGDENPVISEILKWNSSIKFLKDSLLEAISIIISSYNFIMSCSTFARNLIIFNKNLINLFLYKIHDYDFRFLKCTKHEMTPSENYTKFMKYKWRKTKDQLYLLINENCFNDTLVSYK